MTSPHTRYFAMPLLACLMAVAAWTAACPAAFAAVWYVDVDNDSGVEDGTSWQTAFTAIQPAIDAASVGDEVWVAEGVYQARVEDPETGYEALAIIDKSLSIYGGFRGTETELEERDPTANIASLNGDSGAGYGSWAENVVVVQVQAERCVLDGLRLTKGSAPCDQPGGALHWAGASGEVRNCLLDGNRTCANGGAVYAPAADLLLMDCVFESNICSAGAFEQGGGAVYGGPGVMIQGCTFFENSVQSGAGGAVYKAAYVRDCVFEANYVWDADLPRHWGGAIVDVGSAERCSFVRNEVRKNQFRDNLEWRGAGGAGHAREFVNCVFFENSANGSGGAIATDNGANWRIVSRETVRIINCSFWRNEPADIWVVSRPAAIVNSVFRDVRYRGDVTYTVAHSSTASASFFTAPEAGDLRPRYDSPLIDAGLDTEAPEADIDGTPRPQFARSDIGAYEFPAAAPPNATVIVRPADNGTTDPPPGVHDYPLGSEVTVTALPDPGYALFEWSETPTGSQNPLTFVLDESTIVQPRFARQVRVTVEVVGEGTVEPPEAVVFAGNNVWLQATPADGWALHEWRTPQRRTGNSLLLRSVVTPQHVVAVFKRLFNLDVSVDGQGFVGTLRESQSFIDGFAAPPFVEGERLVLWPNPQLGWGFVEWTGDLTGGDTPGRLVMDADKAVTAVFDRLYALETRVYGGGRVEPATGAYFGGEEVVLEAVPDEAWLFDRWEGALQGEANPATLTVTADALVGAHFVYVPARLTTAVSGGGSIVPPPGTHGYRQGETVQIEATPGQGWYFDGWRGDADGAENPLELVMDSDRSVTAVFAFRTPPPGTASLVIDAEGEGTVLPNVETHVYPVGAEVTITATPAEGWRFSHWYGRAVEMAKRPPQDDGATDLGMMNPITIVLTEDAALRAVFVRDTAQPFGCVPADSSGAQPAGFPAVLALAFAVLAATARRRRPARAVTSRR